MRTVSILVSTGPVMLLAAVASAGPVTFTNLDAFLEATDDVREIDFETLPDGSPSVADTLITPDFNYTDQGVTYSSPYPVLAITAPIMGSGFPLSASTPDTTARNWIIADLVTPAYAVGIVFPGTTTLSAFDADMQLIASIGGGGSGAGWFLGVVSDVPIVTVVGDRGSSGELWESFLFMPVPEPGTFVLFVIGAASILSRRRSRSAGKIVVPY